MIKRNEFSFFFLVSAHFFFSQYIQKNRAVLHTYIRCAHSRYTSRVEKVSGLRSEYINNLNKLSAETNDISCMNLVNRCYTPEVKSFQFVGDEDAREIMSNRKLRRRRRKKNTKKIKKNRIEKAFDIIAVTMMKTDDAPYHENVPIESNWPKYA